MIVLGHSARPSPYCIGVELILTFSGQAWEIPLLFVRLILVYIPGLHACALRTIFVIRRL